MIKKFKYTCKQCGNEQIVELDVANYRVYKIICKKCGYSKLINNQTGILNQYYNTTKTTQQKNFQNFKAKNKNSNSLVKTIFLGILNILETIVNVFQNIIKNILFNINSIFFKVLFLLVLAIFLISLGTGIILISQILFLQGDDYIQGLYQNQPNVIYDRNHKVLSELFDIKTGNLSYKEIPENFIQILLFVEDRNFFSHGAIDYLGLFRAIIQNIKSFEFAQGASTITQQLARILLNQREKTITRKLKEAALAYQLERKFTKEEILTYYVNLVYLGHGAYGFQNAARFYYNKELSELNFTEMLSIACLPSRPEYYSPLRNFHRLESKMDYIFNRLQDEKPMFFNLDLETYNRQKQQIRNALNRSPSETVFGNKIDYAPYVSDFIRNRLKQILGEDAVVSRGLKIHTTIDMDLQISAMKESLSHLKEVRKYHPYKSASNEKDLIHKFYLEKALGSIFFGMPVPVSYIKQLETASIGIDPLTGEVRFMQGGSVFQPNNQFNRAIYMRRQTGSAIKPIIYSAGIEDGILTPASIFIDSPIYFSLKEQNREYWIPENIDESYEGRISLREALEKSRNVPALIAAQKIGINRLAIQFQKFFFHTEEQFQKRFKQELAIGIGILEMSPLEMAVAYSAFANNGVIKRPFLIKSIEDSSGKILYQYNNSDEFNLQMPEEKNVLSGDVAEVMISLLKDSAKNGGTKRGGFYSSRLAGKTGTTNEYRDAWFIGLLPQLVVAVWIGFDEPKVSMNKGTGAGLAGPLYGKILKNVYNQYDVGDYYFEPRAEFHEICPTSGKLPNPFCPRTKQEIFSLNNKATEICDYHKSIDEKIIKPPESDFQ